MVPAAAKRWQRWDDVADLFAGRPNPAWSQDIGLVDSVASVAESHFGVLVTVDPMVRAERLRRLSLLQRTFDALPADIVPV